MQVLTQMDFSQKIIKYLNLYIQLVVPVIVIYFKEFEHI